MTETIVSAAPDEASREPADCVRILVCATCRAAGDDPETPRPGLRLAAALTAGLPAGGSDAVRIETVECLSVCKRPCTVALTGAGRWTYVYGDLDPAHGAEPLLAFARHYRATKDGIVPWRERPEIIRKGVVARLPPTHPERPSP